MHDEITFGIGFDPHAIYTREELAERLKGTMAVETLLHGLGIQPRFRHAVLGAEIVGAMERLRSQQLELPPKVVSSREKEIKPNRSTQHHNRMHPSQIAAPADPLRKLTADDLA